MIELIRLIEVNRFDYGGIIRSSTLHANWGAGYRFNVVVPVRGRIDFLPTLLDSLKQTGYQDFFVTVVEHSDRPQHQRACVDPWVNYIHIPSGNTVFNKCLAFNVGVVATPPAKYYIFHDLDCLVQKDFFDNLDGIIERKNGEAIQTFNGRRVIFCDAELTARLVGRITNINELNLVSKGVLPINPNHIGAPGGSILASRELFFKVGGYDPELFWGYSPEDEFFYNKLQFYTTVYSCEKNEVYHMFHPLTFKSNPDIHRLIAVMKRFKELRHEDKKKVIEYKQMLIAEYK